jgi:hypothetical protein
LKRRANDEHTKRIFGTEKIKPKHKIQKKTKPTNLLMVFQLREVICGADRIYFASLIRTATVSPVFPPKPSSQSRGDFRSTKK